MSEEYTTVREALAPSAYHTPAPVDPKHDPRARALELPGSIAAIGLVIFATFSYGLSRVEFIPPMVVTAGTLIGGITLAYGSEWGTKSSIREVFRKYGQGQVRIWDWIALVISLITTCLAIVIGWAKLLELTTGWATWASTQGPLFLALFAALDIYAGHVEHGLLTSQYDKRYLKWEKGYHKWCRDEAVARGWATEGASWQSIVTSNAPVAVGVDEHGTSIMAGGPGDPGFGGNGSKPRATVKIWRTIVGGVQPNDWPQDASGVQELLSERGYAPVAPSTARRWFKEEMPF